MIPSNCRTRPLAGRCAARYRRAVGAPDRGRHRGDADDENGVLRPAGGSLRAIEAVIPASKRRGRSAAHRRDDDLVALERSSVVGTRLPSARAPCARCPNVRVRNVATLGGISRTPTPYDLPPV